MSCLDLEGTACVERVEQDGTTALSSQRKAVCKLLVHWGAGGQQKIWIWVECGGRVSEGFNDTPAVLLPEWPIVCFCSHSLTFSNMETFQKESWNFLYWDDTSCVTDLSAECCPSSVRLRANLRWSFFVSFVEHGVRSVNKCITMCLCLCSSHKPGRGVIDTEQPGSGIQPELPGTVTSWVGHQLQDYPLVTRFSEPAVDVFLILCQLLITLS